MDNLQDVLDKWINDPDFKKNLKKNPEDALKAAGIELAPEDFQKVISKIAEQEILEKKINK